MSKSILNIEKERRQIGENVKMVGKIEICRILLTCSTSNLSIGVLTFICFSCMKFKQYIFDLEFYVYYEANKHRTASQCHHPPTIIIFA